MNAIGFNVTTRAVGAEEVERAIDSILDDLDHMTGIGGSKYWRPPVRRRLAVFVDMLLLR